MLLIDFPRTKDNDYHEAKVTQVDNGELDIGYFLLPT